MFLKATLTAGTLAVALAFSPVAAEAQGVPCYGPWHDCGPAYDNHDRDNYDRDNYDRDNYDDDYGDSYVRRAPYHRSLSCSAARAILGDRGYRRIRTHDCSGRYYVFTAMKRGHAYRIRLSSRNGAITSARRI